MLNNIGWDGRLHRWRGSKTCSQAYLSEAGSPQIFSLWVVHIIKEEGVQNDIAFTYWFDSSLSSCFLILF